MRQGVARLIDRDTEGRIDKTALESRVIRLRQRRPPIEEPCKALADEEPLECELPLIVSRLDDAAAQVRSHLAQLNWAKQRQIIRAWVKRVEIG